MGERRKKKEKEKEEIDPREAARILGRRGGLRGGPAAAAKMTPAERSAAASKAASAAWARLTPEQRSQRNRDRWLGISSARRSESARRRLETMRRRRQKPERRRLAVQNPRTLLAGIRAGLQRSGGQPLRLRLGQTDLIVEALDGDVVWIARDGGGFEEVEIVGADR